MEDWVVLFKNRVVSRFTISEGQELVIGRGQDADVVINNSTVSRRHSSLELKNGQYYLADLLSMNGTKVNRRKIRSAIPISKHDQVMISKFELRPARNLSDAGAVKQPVASVVMDYVNGDMTHYVSGIYNETDLRNHKITKKVRELMVLEGKAFPSKLLLRGEIIKVGRDASCDLRLSGLLLGKIQFTIAYRKDGYVISPLAGLRKTLVNGKRVTGMQPLNEMDVIQVGDTKIKFS